MIQLFFSRFQNFGILIASLLFVSVSVAEVDTDKYDLLKIPQPMQSEKIEVVELFWYNCPHCYQFEQYLGPWLNKLPEDVEVIFMPAVFNEKWAVLAKAYYTAEALGILDKIHHAIFEAIHIKHQRIKTEQDVQAFFTAHGVSPEDFTKTYHNFSVDMKTRRAQLLTQKYGITGVPALIVNGKYRISGSHVTSYKEMVEVVIQLIEQERALLQTDNLSTPSTTH